MNEVIADKNEEKHEENKKSFNRITIIIKSMEKHCQPKFAAPPIPIPLSYQIDLGKFQYPLYQSSVKHSVKQDFSGCHCDEF